MLGCSGTHLLLSPTLYLLQKNMSKKGKGPIISASKKLSKDICHPALIFSASGGMGPAAKLVYKRQHHYDDCSIANHIYRQIIYWLQCRLSFSQLCSSTMCLRGSHSSTGNPKLTETTTELAICDDRVALE